MLTIHKYPITTTFTLHLPVDAQILSVQMQHGAPQMWVLLDTAAEKTSTRFFRVYGTGHEIDAEFNPQFLGTFQLHGGTYVFHLFEGKVP